MDNMFKVLKWTEFRTEPHLRSETRENIIVVMLLIARKGTTNPQRLFLPYDCICSREQYMHFGMLLLKVLV